MALNTYSRNVENRRFSKFNEVETPRQNLPAYARQTGSVGLGVQAGAWQAGISTYILEGITKGEMSN